MLSSYRRTTLDGQPLHPDTQMVSFGYDPALSEGAVKPPVFLTSTRGRGAHVAPSGVTTSFRPPRFLNVIGMWTVIVSPSVETVARVTLLPSCRPQLPAPAQ